MSKKLCTIKWFEIYGYFWILNSTKIGQSWIFQQTKESFDSSIIGNLQVFQNYTKKQKLMSYFIIFHRKV